MSDYLHSIAARGLNQSPAIEPRLASLFETSASAPRLTPSERIVETENQAESAVPNEDPERIVHNASLHADVPRGNPPFLPQTHGGDPSKTESNVATPRRDTSDRSSVPSATSLVARVPRATVESLKGGEKALASVPPTLTEGHDQGRDRGQDRSAELERDFVKGPPIVPPNPGGPESRVGRVLREQTSSQDLPQSRESARDQSDASKSPQAVSTSRTSRQALPALRPAATAVEQMPASPEPSTIRVTIGRVDVRAIMPQAPPPAPAAPRVRPMSLQQYLNQREGDKR